MVEAYCTEIFIKAGAEQCKPFGGQLLVRLFKIKKIMVFNKKVQQNCTKLLKISDSMNHFDLIQFSIFQRSILPLLCPLWMFFNEFFLIKIK